MIASLLLVMFMGCQPCASGYTHIEGMCVPDAPRLGPLSQVASCDAAARGDRLDLEAGCVDEVCLGQSAQHAFDTLGVTYSCARGYECTWNTLGIQLEVDGSEFEGDAVIDRVTVLPPFDGASPEGLVLGLGWSCFVSAFPDSVSTVRYAADADGGLHLDRVEFAVPHLTAEDRSADSGPTDGRVDTLSLLPRP